MQLLCVFNCFNFTTIHSGLSDQRANFNLVTKMLYPTTINWLFFGAYCYSDILNNSVMHGFDFVNSQVSSPSVDELSPPHQVKLPSVPKLKRTVGFSSTNWQFSTSHI